jgi:hypothetical protein
MLYREECEANHIRSLRHGPVRLCAPAEWRHRCTARSVDRTKPMSVPARPGASDLLLCCADRVGDHPTGCVKLDIGSGAGRIYRHRFARDRSDTTRATGHANSYRQSRLTYQSIQHGDRPGPARRGPLDPDRKVRHDKTGRLQKLRIVQLFDVPVADVACGLVAFPDQAGFFLKAGHHPMSIGPRSRQLRPIRETEGRCRTAALGFAEAIQNIKCHQRDRHDRTE